MSRDEEEQEKRNGSDRTRETEDARSNNQGEKEHRRRQSWGGCSRAAEGRQQDVLVSPVFLSLSDNDQHCLAPSLPRAVKQNKTLTVKEEDPELLLP